MSVLFNSSAQECVKLPPTYGGSGGIPFDDGCTQGGIKSLKIYQGYLYSLASIEAIEVTYNSGDVLLHGMLVHVQ